MIDETNEEQLEEFQARLIAFRKSMNQLEKRELRRKTEGPDDEEGASTGLLWIAMRRTDPKAEYDPLLLMTDDELFEAYDKHIPLVQKS